MNTETSMSSNERQFGLGETNTRLCSAAPPGACGEAVAMADGRAIPSIGLGLYKLHGQECVDAITHALEVSFGVVYDVKD